MTLRAYQTRHDAKIMLNTRIDWSVSATSREHYLGTNPRDYAE